MQLQGIREYGNTLYIEIAMVISIACMYSVYTCFNER